MSDSIIIQIADAIVSELNQNLKEFSEIFRAERLYDPERELEDLNTLRVDVVLGDRQQSDWVARNCQRGVYRVDVAVRQKLDTDKPQRLDRLCALLEELDNFFTLPPRRLSGFPEAVPKPSQIVYYYSVQHVRTKRQFTGLLRLTYEVFARAAP